MHLLLRWVANAHKQHEKGERKITKEIEQKIAKQTLREKLKTMSLVYRGGNRAGRSGWVGSTVGRAKIGPVQN